MPTEIEVKTILNKTKKRDPFFLDDYTVNPYSGCSFNCRYCYIRGSKYGENLEMKTSVKINAPQLLEKQLRLKAQKGQYGIIVLASATDPYLHFEEELEITRKLLKIISFYRFPVHIITKSPLVERDFDLLEEIDKIFGSKPSDSKTLVLEAIKKHYPELLLKYEQFFRNSSQLPKYYNQAFSEKAIQLCKEYNIPNHIIK